MLVRAARRILALADDGALQKCDLSVSALLFRACRVMEIRNRGTSSVCSAMQKASDRQTMAWATKEESKGTAKSEKRKECPGTME